MVEGSSSLGGLAAIEGVGFQALLSVILVVDSLWVMEIKGGKSLAEIGVRGEVERPMINGPLQERGDSGRSWGDSCLAKLKKSLGFLAEGVEGEILKLLVRLKNRRDQGKKRGISGTTRFEQELKKLECSINYHGVSRENGSDRGGGDRVSCFK